MVVIAVFGRQRQKDHNFSLTWDYKEFKARLRHIVRPYLKKTITKKGLVEWLKV
jgi:hypothetical protein